MHSRSVIQAREHRALYAGMLRGFEKVAARLDGHVAQTGARYAPASVHSTMQFK
jgi:hypothetical protein